MDQESVDQKPPAPGGVRTEEAHKARNRSVMVLALFDVLGFSERVSRIGLDAIYRHYQELIALVHAKAGGKVVISALPVGNGGMVPVSGWLLIQGAYFSDTILDDGCGLKALIYLAEDDQPGRARPGYLERIVEAALTHGLPSHYVKELRTWLMTGV